jgi:hypothetical protein
MFTLRIKIDKLLLINNIIKIDWTVNEKWHKMAKLKKYIEDNFPEVYSLIILKRGFFLTEHFFNICEDIDNMLLSIHKLQKYNKLTKYETLKQFITTRYRSCKITN